MKWESASVLSAYCWVVSYIENDIKQWKVSNISLTNETANFHFINLLLLLSSSLNGRWVHEPRHFNHSMRLLSILCTWVFECVISSNFPSLCQHVLQISNISNCEMWLGHAGLHGTEVKLLWVNMLWPNMALFFSLCALHSTKHNCRTIMDAHKRMKLKMTLWQMANE